MNHWLEFAATGRLIAALLVLLVLTAAPSFGMGKQPPEENSPGESKEFAEISKDVAESLDIVDRHAGTPDTKLQEAIRTLRENLGDATPSLVDCLTDKGKSRAARMVCSLVMRNGAGNIGLRRRERLLALMRDAGEDQPPRIEAAAILLRNKPEPSPALKREIRRMAISLYKTGEHKDHIMMSVFDQFPDDVEVRDFIVDQLSEEPNASRRDGLILVLGKRKFKGLIPIIEKELNSGNPERLFSKTRMYLALGDIGGEQAFDLLVKSLDKEKDSSGKAMILRGIGVTKHAGAKVFLLSHVKEDPGQYGAAALRGLEFLGDPSVIPVLEGELEKGYTGSRRDLILLTIERIRTGDTRTPW